MWRMQVCTSESKPMIRGSFENLEDGIDWLRQNYPGILARERWRAAESATFRQYGIGFYWASFERDAV